MKILQDYKGRHVRLSDERLRHILEHAEMTNLEGELEETIRYPQLVIASRTDPAAELNYRFFLGTKVGDKWLCVVIKYSVSDAFVVTAYLTDQLKKGRQIWPTK